MLSAIIRTPAKNPVKNPEENPEENLAENPAENKPPPPTLSRLAELACLLSEDRNDEPRALVKRALEIWNAANEELSGCPRCDAHDGIAFAVIAKTRMLPSSREKRGWVRTDKGVGKAVESYFEQLISKYDTAMEGRRIDPQLLKTNEQNLKLLRKKVLGERKLPKYILDLMIQFQLNMRKGSHSVNAQEIRAVLGGADIGLPSSEL
jgi:hypothetical protein